MNQSFLQSRTWEEFQKKIGRKTWRIEDQLIIRHKLPAGFNYLYSPRPKLVNNNLLSGVEKIAKKEKSIFFKIDPVRSKPSVAATDPSSDRISNGAGPVEKLLTINYQLSTTNSIQPQKTAILDLMKSEEKLLSGMHEKTRYNIRLAERRGVRIKNQESRITDKEFEIFWNLLQETAKRDKFGIHPREHYEKLLVTPDSEFSNELFFVRYNEKVIAAIMINFYKPSQTVTYLHGASSSEHREVMAPHLLHWRVIQEAKARGFKYYDFWGIDEEHWPGLTRFKLGFGGEQIEYPLSVDVVYRPIMYKLYKLARVLK